MAPAYNWKEFAAHSEKAQEALQRSQEGMRATLGEQAKLLALLAKGMETLERDVRELNHELLGNGQKGRMQVVEELLQSHAKLAAGLPAREARVEKVEERLDGQSKRIGALEKWRWFLGGAIAVMGPLVLWLLGRL